MGCSGCAKRRAMMKSEYQVVAPDGTTTTFNSLRDAQAAAARKRGSRVMAVPVAPKG